MARNLLATPLFVLSVCLLRASSSACGGGDKARSGLLVATVVKSGRRSRAADE